MIRYTYGALCVLFGVFLLHHIVITEAKHALTWDLCGCHWNGWEAWSSCNKTCLGRQQRDRKVTINNKPGCTKFSDCSDSILLVDVDRVYSATDAGGQIQKCNMRCSNGGTVRTVALIDSCSCPPGTTGPCCETSMYCNVACMMLISI
jgi:hypothetical protein